LTEKSKDWLRITFMFDIFHFEHFKVLFWEKYQQKTVLKITCCQYWFAYLKGIYSVFLSKTLCTRSSWYLFYEYKIIYLCHIDGSVQFFNSFLINDWTGQLRVFFIFLKKNLLKKSFKPDHDSINKVMMNNFYVENFFLKSF
jgi:hypothetical protein